MDLSKPSDHPAPATPPEAPHVGPGLPPGAGRNGSGGGKGKSNNTLWIGLGCGCLGLILLIVIAIIVAIAIPAFLKAKERAKQKAESEASIGNHDETSSSASSSSPGETASEYSNGTDDTKSTTHSEISEMSKADKKALAITVSKETADPWLALLDAGEYDECYHTAAEAFRSVTLEQWHTGSKSLETEFGHPETRKLKRYEFSVPTDGTSPPTLLLTYESTFPGGKNARELVTFVMVDGDVETWGVSDYSIENDL